MCVRACVRERLRPVYKSSLQLVLGWLRFPSGGSDGMRACAVTTPILRIEGKLTRGLITVL